MNSGVDHEIPACQETKLHCKCGRKPFDNNATDPHPPGRAGVSPSRNEKAGETAVEAQAIVLRNLAGHSGNAQHQEEPTLQNSITDWNKNIPEQQRI